METVSQNLIIFLTVMWARDYMSRPHKCKLYPWLCLWWTQKNHLITFQFSFPVLEKNTLSTSCLRLLIKASCTAYTKMTTVALSELNEYNFSYFQLPYAFNCLFLPAQYMRWLLFLSSSKFVDHSQKPTQM